MMHLIGDKTKARRRETELCSGSNCDDFKMEFTDQGTPLYGKFIREIGEQIRNVETACWQSSMRKGASLTRCSTCATE